MKIEPKFAVSRLDQLVAGELFILEWNNSQSAAIKVTDPQMNGQKFMLLLGPAFNQGTSEPELIQEQRLSVISFGKNYIMQFPATPDKWILSSKLSDKFYIATNGEDVFARMPRNFGGPYFIDLKAGEICQSYPQGNFAYTSSWSIGVQDGEKISLVVEG